MKFSILTGIPNSGCRSRLGKICDLQRLPNIELDTPLLLLHTKGGSVTHLTREVLQKVTTAVEALQIPLSNTSKCFEGIKGYNGTIAEFVGLKEYISYCTTHDPSVNTPHGHNKKSAISMWTSNGRRELTSDSFMDVIEAYQPDFYEVMSDSDNDANSTMKRLRKSVDYSREFLLNCLRRHKISKVLQNSAALGVVEGGYSLPMRERFIEHLNQHTDCLNGFVISGLHSNGPDVESLTLESVAPVISHTLKLLPEDKIRIVHGCWQPQVVVGLVDLGIDVFDSSLIDMVTERYGAFVFSYEAVRRSSEPEPKFPVSINCQTVNDTSNECDKSKDNNSSYQLEICLKETKYFDDFSPILKGCTCLTCKNHTKAYVHHLYTTKELLGPVLLTIHNLHHYLQFFSFIRNTVRKGLSVNII